MKECAFIGVALLHEFRDGDKYLAYIGEQSLLLLLRIASKLGKAARFLVGEGDLSNRTLYFLIFLCLYISADYGKIVAYERPPSQ
jgi:hypothetical protein